MAPVWRLLLGQSFLICIEVHLNERLICRAGVADACILNCIVGAGVGGDQPASFHVAGMLDLPEDRAAHVYWSDESALAPPDHLRIALVDSDEPSPPLRVTPTDSPEYLEEQRQFAELEKSTTSPPVPGPKRWPNATLSLRVNNSDETRATLKNQEEHILCSTVWDKWRPEFLRVYVRSFSSGWSKNEAKTEWLRANLRVGEYLDIGVEA